MELLYSSLCFKINFKALSKILSSESSKGILQCPLTICNIKHPWYKLSPLFFFYSVDNRKLIGTILTKEKTLYPLFSATNLNESLAKKIHIYKQYNLYVLWDKIWMLINHNLGLLTWFFSLISGKTSLSTPELGLHSKNRFQIDHFFLNFLLL